MIKFLCFCFVWLNNLPFFHSLWCLLRKHFKTSPSFVTRVLGPCWDDKTWKSPSATEWRAKLTLNFVVRSYATMMTMLSSPVACVKALQMIKENSQNLLSLSSVHYCASYPLVRENSVCDDGDELMMACVMLLSEELIKIYVTPASAAFAQRRRLCVDKLYKLAHTHDSYSVSSSDDNDDVDEWCLHCRRRHRARCCVSFLSHFSAFHFTWLPFFCVTDAPKHPPHSSHIHLHLHHIHTCNVHWYVTKRAEAAVWIWNAQMTIALYCEYETKDFSLTFSSLSLWQSRWNDYFAKNVFLSLN